MSSLFVATGCKLENGLIADLVSWSNADLIAAVSANPSNEDNIGILNEIVFVNNEVSLINQFLYFYLIVIYIHIYVLISNMFKKTKFKIKFKIFSYTIIYYKYYNISPSIYHREV
jgi:hypothetical protein